MARTRVLLLVAALLLFNSELGTAQTVDKVSGNPTSLEQQKAASHIAATKAAASPTRVSQMRDPTGRHLVLYTLMPPILQRVWCTFQCSTTCCSPLQSLKDDCGYSPAAIVLPTFTSGNKPLHCSRCFVQPQPFCSASAISKSLWTCISGLSTCMHVTLFRVQTII